MSFAWLCLAQAVQPGPSALLSGHLPQPAAQGCMVPVALTCPLPPFQRRVPAGGLERLMKGCALVVVESLCPLPLPLGQPSPHQVVGSSRLQVCFKHSDLP